MNETISVVLADDDAQFRAVLRKLFDRTDGFRVVAEAADGAQAVRAVLALKPAVALLDVQMPVMDGLETAREILSATDTRIIMLTTFDLDEYVEAALTLGASGFLLKNAAPPEVLQAVRAVHAGNAMLASEVMARLVAQFAPPAPSRPVRLSGSDRLGGSGRSHAFAGQVLSARELQVIRLVADGYSNQEIATQLFLSLETVRTYLRRMFAKLDVRDRTHLAILAHQAGLLHEPR